MGKCNLAVNQLLERKEVFADLVNGSLFGGKRVVDPEKLELKSGHTGVITKTDKRKTAALERYGDIRMEADMEKYSLIIAEETQNEVDYAMPVRNMLYDALEYTKQIKELGRTHRQSGMHLTQKEILSGMTKEDRLKPVITLVLYCGDNWDGNVCLHEMLDIDRENETAKEIMNLIPDYRIHLICPAEMEDVTVYHSCLQYIFSMVKYKENKTKLCEYMQENREELESLDYVETLAAFVLLGETNRAETYLYGKEEKEGISVCKAIDDLIADGRSEGEERLSTLIRLMIQENSHELISQVVNDKSFREQMYRKYNLQEVHMLAGVNFVS